MKNFTEVSRVQASTRHGYRPLPGLAEEGVGVKPSGASAKQTMHPGMGFGCQEERMTIFKGTGYPTGSQQDRLTDT